MNLFEIPLADLAPKHLNYLVDNAVSETSTLEFKRETYGNSDDNKKELLKDVSALANTHGGLLLIGISEEKKGYAGAIFPFEGEADAEIQRLNAIIGSSIEPIISDIEMHPIRVEGGSVIVIKVPKSWSAPHRISFKNVKRFHKRISTVVYEPDVTELKKMFNASIERETQFKALRQRHINCVKNEETPIVMPNSTDASGFMLLQLIPLQALEGIETIDLASDHLQNSLWPIGAKSGWDHCYNIDGFLTFRPMFHSYTQLYRNGIIEAASCSIVNQSDGGKPQKIISGRMVAGDILKSTARYLTMLNKLGVQVPVRMYVSLLDVKNCRFATYDDSSGISVGEASTFSRDDVLLPPIDIMQFGDKTEVYESLRPILDALWNADNKDRCDYYDDKGKWVDHENLNVW